MPHHQPLPPAKEASGWWIAADNGGAAGGSGARHIARRPQLAILADRPSADCAGRFSADRGRMERENVQTKWGKPSSSAAAAKAMAMLAFSYWPRNKGNFHTHKRTQKSPICSRVVESRESSVSQLANRVDARNAHNFKQNRNGTLDLLCWCGLVVKEKKKKKKHQQQQKQQ